MAMGAFMRHQTNNNMEVQNKTISETNAQGTLLLRPQGDGEWLWLMPLWTSNLIRREGERRDSKSRRSWRGSKDQARQKRRAAGKAGDRGYEVLPVTATRTGTSQQSGCQPRLAPEVLGPKALHKPVSKASPCSRVPAGALGEAGSCAHPLGLLCHNSSCAFRRDQGGYEGSDVLFPE